MQSGNPGRHPIFYANHFKDIVRDDSSRGKHNKTRGKTKLFPKRTGNKCFVEEQKYIPHKHAILNTIFYHVANNKIWLSHAILTVLKTLINNMFQWHKMSLL